MKVINIRAERNYEVESRINWNSRLAQLTANRNYRVIVPSSIAEKVSREIPASHLIIAPEGESQKTFSFLEEVLEKLAIARLSRDSLLVGIGGGATTDLTGFAAATYLRGIEWIAIPTSVAGMVDAAIGGKTGINLTSGKNLAGSFYSPIKVLIDFDWIESLLPRDINAGLSEAVKCGFIADEEILSLMEGNLETNLPEIIERSVAVKASVVSSDFKESGQREILNYGHTLGHAIEKDSKFSLRHGEAIAIGMHYAAALSVKIEGLSDEIFNRHQEILKRIEQPLYYDAAAWESLYSYMLNDKKRNSDEVRFVSLKALGECGRINVSESILREVYLKQIGRS